MMSRQRWVAWRLVAALVLAGCARGQSSLPLLAAFSDESRVGRITATWVATGLPHPATGGGPAQRELRYSVDLLNESAEPVFVRLRDFRVLAGTAEAARAGETVACALRPGPNPGVLHGTLWVGDDRLAALNGFDLNRFAVPLSERGRAFYREFLLGQRPGDATAIDAEIATYTSAPACAGG
jgi:hypothetical protein